MLRATRGADHCEVPARCTSFGASATPGLRCHSIPPAKRPGNSRPRQASMSDLNAVGVCERHGSTFRIATEADR